MRQISAVKTATVGCGAISDIFFKNFTERFEILDLVSCCSRGRISAEKKANQYGIHASTLEEILHGIRQSGESKQTYRLTTRCERPAPLSKGYRGLPGFCFPEESSLIL